MSKASNVPKEAVDTQSAAAAATQSASKPGGGSTKSGNGSQSAARKPSSGGGKPKLGRAKKANNAQANKKRNMMIVVIGVMVLIAVVAIWFITMGSTTIQKSQEQINNHMFPVMTGKPRVIATNAPRIAPTESTIDLKNRSIYHLNRLCYEVYGDCFYFDGKYTDNCKTLKCENVNMRIEANIEFRPYSWLMGYSVFKLPRDSPVEITLESVPCMTSTGQSGLCEKDTCVVVENPHLKKYDALQPINGGYGEPATSACLALTEDINAKFSALHHTQCLSDKTKCVPYTVRLLEYRSPIPRYGGTPCWGHKA